MLDPRVAYVMTSMMEGVVNTGTGFIVRQMGFTAPAAGKTGTSHDAWFAGYTSNLLCIVWVGLDDYSDIRLSGTAAAAPIWAEFMKRATTIQGYRDATDFKQPDGVIDVRLDKDNEPAGDPFLPGDVYGGVHCRDGAERYLRSEPGRTSGSAGEDLWVDESEGADGIGPSEPEPTRPSGAPAATKWGDGSGCGATRSAETREEKGLFWQAGGGFKGDDDKQQGQNDQQPSNNTPK